MRLEPAQGRSCSAAEYRRLRHKEKRVKKKSFPFSGTAREGVVEATSTGRGTARGRDSRGWEPPTERRRRRRNSSPMQPVVRLVWLRSDIASDTKTRGRSCATRRERGGSAESEGEEGTMNDLRYATHGPCLPSIACTIADLPPLWQRR
jgi:hypothetical protein